MVNIPKTCWTFCNKCGRHQPYKVTQYWKEEDSLCAQGNGIMAGIEWLCWAN
jgi:ribosomal protein L44E